MDALTRRLMMLAALSRGPKVAGTAQATGTANTLTIGKPAQTASGMLLVGAMGVDEVTTWTGASGWTQRAQQPSYRPSLRIATNTAGASEPASYEFAPARTGKDEKAGHILAVANGAYDSVGNWIEAVGPSTLAVPGITLSKRGLLLVTIGLQNSSASVASEDGMALVADTASGNRTRIVTFVQRVGAGPTGSRNFTVTGSSLGAGGIAIGLVKP